MKSPIEYGTWVEPGSSPKPEFQLFFSRIMRDRSQDPLSLVGPSTGGIMGRERAKL
ncbi:MAG: hypothetical protein JSU72_15070 [Deltaproteobacteria bacterium]|nr:MAG: hypothetical protein JSU72_15070 [Deltaproteobacteria bacterium]